MASPRSATSCVRESRVALVPCAAARRTLAASELSRKIGEPPDGGGCITFPLSSAPMAISSYFGCFRLRQPLPAEIGGHMSGGNMGSRIHPRQAAMPPTQAGPGPPAKGATT
jgi:hypothetical protein